MTDHPPCRRKDDQPGWHRYERAVRWLALVVIALVMSSLWLDQRSQASQLKGAIERLDARQSALCVVVKKGRIVFKKLVDQNGLFVATRVSVVDCPPPVIPKEHKP